MTNSDHMIVQVDADATNMEKQALINSANIAGANVTLFCANYASVLAYRYQKRYEFDDKA